MLENGNRLQPYNDIWLDCVNNNLISMLIEVDKSFRDIPLVMGVTYSKIITKQRYSTEEARLKMLHEGYLFPTISYSTKTIQNHIRSKEFSFDETFDHLLDLIKTNLSDGNYIFVTIDRYYYPLGREAGKTHMVHPVFIFGYSDEEQVFHAIEDCVHPGVMNFYKVPYSSLERSSLSLAEQGIPVTGSICKTLSTSLENTGMQARKQAESMALHLLQDTTFYNERYDLHYHNGITCLEALLSEFDDLLDNLQEDSLFKIFTMQFPQLHQRNRRLVALLQENGYISEDCAEELNQQYRSLQSQWESYKKRSYYQLESRNKTSVGSSKYRQLLDRMEGIIASEQKAAQRLLESLNKL